LIGPLENFRGVIAMFCAAAGKCLPLRHFSADQPCGNDIS
jgi:hypothetical protein